MIVVILYIKIRDDDDFFIFLNIICDVKIVLVEKNLEKNIGWIFFVCDKLVIILWFNNFKMFKGCL